MFCFRPFALFFLALAGVIRAAPIDSIYIGPSGTFDQSPTNYSVADNWSPTGVPNNSQGSSFTVTIPKDVFVDIPVAINTLTIDAEGSLTVKDTPEAAGSFVAGSSFTNSGTLSVYNSTFSSLGTLSNFDGIGTLSGGTFIVEGFDLSASAPRSSVFEFADANIVTNQSSITLINHAMIVDQIGRDGLRRFVDNTAAGTFVVGSGYNFMASDTFTNAGIVTVQAAIPDVNGLAIGEGSFSVLSGHGYVQTAGTTTIGGSLTADLTDIQGGTFVLGGTVNGTLAVEAASFFPTGLLGPQQVGDMSLTMDSTMQFSIPSEATIVDGQFTSSDYDHLSVTGDLTLGNCTLAVQVAAGFPISSHSSFTVINSTGTIGGRLGNVSSGSRLTTLDGLNSFVVTLAGQVLQLSSFQTIPPAAQFANLSTRGEVLSGDNILIGGFIVVGTQPKNVILRALGPSLANAGVSDPLADPVLELHDSTGAVIASNNNWKDTQEFAIESTGIPPTNDLESALVTSLQPGAYTVFVYGNNGGTGTALVEVYDLSPNVDTTLSNLSTRGFVDPANPLIGGFISGVGVGGSETVARAIGPDLASQGVTHPLSDPMLEVRDINGNLIASNDDYVPGSDPILELDGLEPVDGRDSAIRLSLAPGAYTVLVLAKALDSGTGLVELYDLYH